MNPPVNRDQSTRDQSEAMASEVGGDTVAASPKVLTSESSFAPSNGPGEVGRLGPYRIVKELGRGGMGAVYAALDTRLERKIALKVMLPEFAADGSAKERFLREARAAAKISHDNVVTVYEADERDGVPYIAMQFLQGYPLDVYLKKKGNPSIAQVLRVARETAAGLAAAHKIGLVHRDIKPANLWLEAPNGRVKVLDFGLAKPVDAEVEITKSGAVVGTPAYMSPEQARGEKVDHRTDLFSLGAVLYRLCTGKLPFAGPNTMAVLIALGTEEPPPVRSMNPDVPEALAELIHQLLSKKAENRPQSMDEVGRRVRAISDELSTPMATGVTEQPQVVYVPLQITAVPDANPFEDIEVTEAMSVPESKPLPAPPEKSDRKPILAVGSGLAAVALLAVGGYAILKNKSATEPKKNEAPEVVVVKENKPAPKPPAPKVVDDPERKVAEWVVDKGGAVRINVAMKDIRSTAELPKDRFTITYVNLANSNITDSDVARLKEMKSLTHIYMANTKVSNVGLAHLKDLTSLTDLDLGGTQVTGAGLVNLKDLKALVHLDLSGTLVLDADLVHLKELKRLGWLLLHRTSVSDTGLAHLEEIKSLTHLEVKKSSVTLAGLEAFHSAVPGCLIEYDGGMLPPKK